VKRIWLVAAVFLLAGCGVQPSGVIDRGEAPTGVAPGVTLYFINARNELQPQQRPTGQLGTIPEAMTLLLSGSVRSNLRTEITSNTTARVVVTPTPDVIQLRVPLTIHDVTALGIDQIVCTALGVHVQGGGSKSMKVQILFTLPTPESDEHRTCPLIR
jgi:hypothetical protein